MEEAVEAETAQARNRSQPSKSLSISQKESLNALISQFPDASDEELLGYLKFRHFNTAKAAIQYRPTMS